MELWLNSPARGYPIEQVAAQSTFLETAYLLIYGDLPNKSQYRMFEGEVMHHSTAHSDAEVLFRAFRYAFYAFGRGTVESYAVLDTMRIRWQF